MKTFGECLPGVVYRDRPAAYAVILDARRRVAAVRGASGFYFLPGGGLHPGETPEAAILREIREELGRTATLGQKLDGAIQYFLADETRYRMEATFHIAELGPETGDPAEYPLLWLDLETVERGFFHECQKWAVRMALRRAENPHV